MTFKTKFNLVNIFFMVLGPRGDSCVCKKQKAARREKGAQSFSWKRNVSYIYI